MKAFRTSLLRRFLGLLLCAVVLNVSIDPPDHPIELDNVVYTHEEDLSINEMESVVEVVLEKILHIDNAVPESEEADNEAFLKKIDFYLYQPLVPVSPLILSAGVIRASFPRHQAGHYSISLDITSPPPKPQG